MDQRSAALLAADRLGRRKGVGAPVRRAFVMKSGPDTPSPLGELLSGSRAAALGGGGRGGRLRVLVLVTLIWAASAPPYGVQRPARWWAELLGLPEPDGNGSRTIRSTFRELEKRGFVRVEKTSDEGVAQIFPLEESGSEEPYEPAGAVALREPERDERGYFRVPDAFWTSGLCAQLSGAALSMYLICLSVGWREEQPFWFSGKAFKDRFGLSDSTRKKGLRELVELGVLSEDERSIDSEGGSMGRRFKRKIYLLSGDHRAQRVLFEM